MASREVRPQAHACLHVGHTHARREPAGCTAPAPAGRRSPNAWLAVVFQRARPSCGRFKEDTPARCVWARGRGDGLRGLLYLDDPRPPLAGGSPEPVDDCKCRSARG